MQVASSMNRCFHVAPQVDMCLFVRMDQLHLMRLNILLRLVWSLSERLTQEGALPQPQEKAQWQLLSAAALVKPSFTESKGPQSSVPSSASSPGV